MALPFAFILLLICLSAYVVLMCLSLLLGLRTENQLVKHQNALS
ncbi:hypothetical protein VCRA2126O85_70049 [Vibrio crassostreae]|nr:hypothetical protein VCRA2126O85_70049 [Vibrio crassostreae]CAK3084226.1 hypothetical protein VCRA2128O106_70049 [Vibrio crassostreae]CAK3175161.1 hypothetical protein VCRA2128O101_180047 [Vibrio crassostreae]CAK3252714.1 hypothetical protein VCRA2128O107_170051 [Vibrio crassostreae]CAK3268310.1 hypothetical protein VCRA2126O87_180047 [Vibrio crassostreae]